MFFLLLFFVFFIQLREICTAIRTSVPAPARRGAAGTRHLLGGARPVEARGNERRNPERNSVREALTG